jgi:hypothetical protein
MHGMRRRRSPLVLALPGAGSAAMGGGHSGTRTRAVPHGAGFLCAGYSAASRGRPLFLLSAKPTFGRAPVRGRAAL